MYKGNKVNKVKFLIIVLKNSTSDLFYHKLFCCCFYFWFYRKWISIPNISYQSLKIWPMPTFVSVCTAKGTFWSELRKNRGSIVSPALPLCVWSLVSCCYKCFLCTKVAICSPLAVWSVLCSCGFLTSLFGLLPPSCWLPFVWFMTVWS